MERKSMTGSFFWDHVRTEMDVGTKKTKDNEQVDRTLASERAIYERLCKTEGERDDDDDFVTEDDNMSLP